MAIAFYAEDTKLPAIKKRAGGNFLYPVADRSLFEIARSHD